MVELIVLSAFAVMLIVGTALSFPLTSILTIGFFLFFGYGLSRKISAKKLLLAAFESVWEVKTIIALFAVVGAMSAAWRAAGTIPEIVSISRFSYFSFCLYSGNLLTLHHDVHAFRHRIWYCRNHGYHLHVYW